MRVRDRSLHVLAIAPLAALTAAFAGSPVHVLADDAAPQPVAVAIDPGHGGSPNAADPTQPFDPGTIGPNGVLEKDVALDVAKRLAALLRQDEVNAVLTRTGDQEPSLEQREQVAIDAHADVFVSIHCNSYRDPAVGGSLVLYPNPMGQPLAQALSDALTAGLAPARVAADGIQLRDNWWIHAPMPTSTAEIAYLSNPREAALLATPDFREQVARALRNGIEAFDPTIGQRKAAILAWRQAHVVTPPPPPAPAHPAAAHAATAQRSAPGSAWGSVLFWACALLACAALVRWRRPVARAVGTAIEAGSETWQGRSLHHAAARRRRRRTRVRPITRPRAWPPQSVYDELSF